MSADTALRVLVVEDEALLAMDIEAVVEDAGHQLVGEAACTRSAEALPDDTDPHLAFVDLQLAHGTNGLDVSGMIRRRWPETVVVFVTANPRLIPVDYGGPFGVIAKPFSHTGLTAALRYLNEGIIRPPPSSPLPAVLRASPGLMQRLKAA